MLTTRAMRCRTQTRPFLHISCVPELAGRHVGCLARVKMIPSPTVVIHSNTAVHETNSMMTLKTVAAVLAHLLKTLPWSRTIRL